MARNTSRNIDDRWLRNPKVARFVWWERGLLRPGHTHDGRGQFFEGAPQDRGYTYMPAKKISGIVTSDDQDEAFDIAGAWRLGRCSFTCSAKLDLGPQDRITFLDMPIRTSEEITRGAGAADILTSYLGATEVVGIVDGDGTVYRAGFDFQLSYSADRTISEIRWEGTDAPTTSTVYAVHLNVRPRWIIKDQPKTRSFGKNQLPLRVTLIADDQRVRT